MASPALQELSVDLCTTRQQSNACAVDQRTSPAGSRFSHYVTRTREIVAPIASVGMLAALILYGWVNRDEGHLTPESGLGYWLGIAGASSMLLLLIYPLRKRLKSMRLFGSVALWFRVHMFLGLAGPTLILFHSNFQLGSINSNVALVAMLVVAVSGLAGRYLYGKIHLGLYGRKAAVREILADANALRRLAGDQVVFADRAIAELDRFTKLVFAPRNGVLANLWLLSVLNVRTRRVRTRLSTDARRTIMKEGKRRGWSRRVRRQRIAAVVELVTLHLAAVKKAAAFAFYERLFSLWHVLHLPLFFLLVLAAVIHVVAVHLY
jgi:hypothetical protein